MSSVEQTHYEVLDVSVNATTEQIRLAYKKAVRTAHPDSGGNPEHFHAVAEAYRVLSNVKQRSEYDLRLRRGALINGTGLKGTGYNSSGLNNSGQNSSAAARARTAPGAKDNPLASVPRYVPELGSAESAALMSAAGASTQVYGQPIAERASMFKRKAAQQHLHAQADTIRWLNGTVLENYKAARLLNGVNISTGAKAIIADHVLLGGTKAALIESVAVNSEPHTFDGRTIWQGSIQYPLESLRLKLMELNLLLPQYTVSAWAVLVDSDRNPFTPVITDIAPRGAKEQDLSVASHGNVVRELTQFFTEQDQLSLVNLRTVQQLRERTQNP